MSTKTVPSIRAPIFWSAIVVASTVATFGYWGYTQEIASAAMAQGTVIVENRRAKLQHFEGGIVTSVDVSEGDYVRKGDSLLVLANAEDSANLERLTTRQISLQAERIRLLAELNDYSELDFSSFKKDWPVNLSAAEAVQLQTQLFEVRHAQRVQAVSIAEDDLSRAKESIVGLNAQLGAKRLQLDLLETRLTDIEGMLQKGLTTQIQANDLRAQVAGLSADIAQLESSRRAGLTEIEQKSDEIIRIQANYAVRAGDRLNTIELELAELENTKVAALDVMNRSRLVAPMAGRVVGMTINTVGAVIASGDVVLEIVPAEDRLVVEALIRPEDIDVVAPGMDVDVRLTALSFRNTLPVAGTLQQISADRIVEGRSGAAIYKGIVVLDLASGQTPDGTQLYPGMGAEVAIKTGARTLVDYLLDPISRSISRAFRET
ncbi:MAG: HlyD family type I secretion periplasmic adaptor subunit [Pseudomonadota bacterium]